MSHEKRTQYIGVAAMVFGIVLFLSNLDQASRNIHGVKGSIVLSVALLINCIFWTIYGLLKKDKAVRISNGVGVITSLIVVFTYFAY